MSQENNAPQPPLNLRGGEEGGGDGKECET